MAAPLLKTIIMRQKRSIRAPEKEFGITLLRWVKLPDGELEQVELPLTSKRFLNPHLGD